MIDAPERIWAFYNPDIAEDENGATIIAHENIQHGSAEYVRADLCNGKQVNDRNAILDEAIYQAKNGCLVPPDGGSPTEAEIEMCDRIAERIAYLKQEETP